MTIKPWPSIERGVRNLLLAKYGELAAMDPAAAEQLVGGDDAFDGTQDFYIKIFRVGGRSDQIGGYFIVDIEVFGTDYLQTDSRLSAIDAVVLGYPHVVEVEDRTWVFDSVTQTAGPQALPWEDDAVTRLGATYVITARRR